MLCCFKSIIPAYHIVFLSIIWPDLICIFLVIAFVYCDIVERESCHIQLFLEIYLRQLQNHLLPKNQTKSEIRINITIFYFCFIYYSCDVPVNWTNNSPFIWKNCRPLNQINDWLYLKQISYWEKGWQVYCKIICIDLKHWCY